MGIEDNATPAANVAGYWTIGVAKGLMIVAVPVVVFSMAVGVMGRISRIGSKLGGGK